MSGKTLRGGEFIIKDSAYEDIFSLDDLNEEQKMMRDSVRDFVDREIAPYRERFEEHDYDLVLKIMKKAGKMGFLGTSVPEKYDGFGMDFVSSVLVTDYISGISGSIATAFGAHTGIATLPIVLYSTDMQKEKYLPKLASGEWIGAYALSEPEAGSDANSGKTSAKLSEDKKYYIINGQKMWISNAGFASVFIVFARIDDDKYLSAFIVDYDKDNPNGIDLGHEEEKLGINSSSTRQVFFENTKVPVENMLSERGRGFKIAMNILNIGRIKLAAGTIDVQRRITTQAVNYANERKQFNTKIANFEAIKGLLTEMTTNAYVTESATYHTAKLIEDRNQEFLKGDASLSKAEAKLKAVEEFAVECSFLKVAASENSQTCSDNGIQIFGGMGYSRDAPVEAAWRDARITRIYEGTNEINRMHGVGMLLKKAASGELDLLTPAKAIQDELTSIQTFETADSTELFAEEKQILNRLKKAFLMIAGSAIQKYTTEFQEHQYLLLAVADILIQIFLTEATLLRTEKMARSAGKDNQKIQIAMSQLQLYKAVEKINQKGKEAIISFTSGDKQKMLLTGLKRFTKYQNYPNIDKLKNIIADKVITANKYCF